MALPSRGLALWDHNITLNWITSLSPCASHTTRPWVSIPHISLFLIIQPNKNKIKQLVLYKSAALWQKINVDRRPRCPKDTGLVCLWRLLPGMTELGLRRRLWFSRTRSAIGVRLFPFPLLLWLLPGAFGKLVYKPLSSTWTYLYRDYFGISSFLCCSLGNCFLCLPSAVLQKQPDVSTACRFLAAYSLVDTSQLCSANTPCLWKRCWSGETVTVLNTKWDTEIKN